MSNRQRLQQTDLLIEAESDAWTQRLTRWLSSIPTASARVSIAVSSAMLMAQPPCSALREPLDSAVSPAAPGTA